MEEEKINPNTRKGKEVGSSKSFSCIQSIWILLLEYYDVIVLINKTNRGLTEIFKQESITPNSSHQTVDGKKRQNLDREF